MHKGDAVAQRYVTDVSQPPSLSTPSVLNTSSLGIIDLYLSDKLDKIQQFA